MTLAYNSISFQYTSNIYLTLQSSQIQTNQLRLPVFTMQLIFQAHRYKFSLCSSVTFKYTSWALNIHNSSTLINIIAPFNSVGVKHTTTKYLFLQFGQLQTHYFRISLLTILPVANTLLQNISSYNSASYKHITTEYLFLQFGQLQTHYYRISLLTIGPVINKLLQNISSDNWASYIHIITEYLLWQLGQPQTHYYRISLLTIGPVVKFDINKKRRKFLPVLPSFLPPSVKQSSHTHTHTYTQWRLVSSLLLSLLSLLNSPLSSHLPMYSPQWTWAHINRREPKLTSTHPHRT